MKTSGLKIFLADDHEVMRKGLRTLLEGHPGWSVCGEANNGRDAVRLVAEVKPDVVVLDIEMPGLNGVEATREIKSANPKVEVVVFTMHDSEHLIRAALRVGARGYVLKTDKEQNLIDAVDTLSRHKPFLTGKASQLLLDNLLKSSDLSEQGSALSHREREIIQLLADGKSNKQIASVLQISIKTVESHRAAVMRKLGFTSIVQLVRYAIRNDFIKS